MPDTLLGSLKRLARQKRGLRETGRALADTERRLVQRLTHVLPSIGYRLVSLGGGQQRGGTVLSGRRKRLRCPKCDRRFAHPLPLSRHLSATHGKKKAAKKPRPRPSKAAKS